MALRNNGGESLNFTSDTTQTFSLAVARGASYDVRVDSRNGAFCQVADGSGTALNDVTIHVSCMKSGLRDTTFANATLIGFQENFTMLNSGGDKLLIGGGTDTSDSNWRLARFDTATQTLDTGFGMNGYREVSLSGTGAQERITCLGLQSDGKIVAVGKVGMLTAFALARFNTNGSLDTTFGPDETGIVTYTVNGTEEGAQTCYIDASDSIWVAGSVRNGEGQKDARLLHFSKDGLVDESHNFSYNISANTNIVTMEQLEDGNFVIGGDASDLFLIILIDYQSGAGNTLYWNSPYSVTAPSALKKLKRMPNGSIMMAGYCPVLDSSADECARAILPNGYYDTSFNGGDAVYSGTKELYDSFTNIFFQEDGRVVFGGIAAGGTPIMLRRTASGAYDNTFGNNGYGSYSAVTYATTIDMVADSKGRILVGGYYNSGITLFRVAP